MTVRPVVIGVGAGRGTGCLQDAPCGHVPWRDMFFARIDGPRETGGAQAECAGGIWGRMRKWLVQGKLKRCGATTGEGEGRKWGKPAAAPHSASVMPGGHLLRPAPNNTHFQLSAGVTATYETPRRTKSFQTRSSQQEAGNDPKGSFPRLPYTRSIPHVSGQRNFPPRDFLGGGRVCYSAPIPATKSLGEHHGTLDGQPHRL